ncbi:MAG: hypothetical protein L3J96_00715 [Thermoplasmata archaeon]|nr:hypothetical protein [Thermoplasmata archaeon]
MKVFAIDCDATCEGFGGPVPINALLRLAVLYEVWVIGNRQLSIETGLPHVGILASVTILGGREYPGGGKVAALLALRRRYPQADQHLNVDDDPGDYEIASPGWDRVSPARFVAGLGDYLTDGA